MSQVKSTEALVHESMRGNSASFNELVLRFERLAWSTAWKVLRNHHAASDATQNAFVEAYCNLNQLRSPPQFASWLIRIAHREAVRLAQSHSSTISPEQLDDRQPERATDSSADRDDLLSAVTNLPEHERIVVVLRYFNGHSIDEIGRITGRPIGTISKQISRAVTRLKSVLRIEEPR